MKRVCVLARDAFSNVFNSNAVAFVCIATALLSFFCRYTRAEDVCDEEIYIDNYANGESQSYPLALLKGRLVPSTNDDTLVVENLSSSKGMRISRAPIVNGRFKALIELIPGENRLTISSGTHRRDFCLYYNKSLNRYFVRLVIFTDSSGKPLICDFTTGLNLDPALCSQKLRVAGLLWQTATAESFNDARLGRKTFTLEYDGSGNVVVWIQRGKKTAAEYAAMSERDRFHCIYQEILSGNAGSAFARYFALIALPQPKANEEISKDSRIALGGGCVGMLDAETFFTWPSSLDSVYSCFSDSRPIAQSFLRDAAYRNAVWALTSSSIGAGLHELGHALDLDHVDDPNDFMSRGFDKFNRIFIVNEPSLTEPGVSAEFSQDDVARWGRVNTAKLLQSPWIKN